jgi:hypothetical protein
MLEKRKMFLLARNKAMIPWSSHLHQSSYQIYYTGSQSLNITTAKDSTKPARLLTHNEQDGKANRWKKSINLVQPSLFISTNYQ